jgi:hypothetical protein
MYMYYVQRYDEGVQCTPNCTCDATVQNNFCTYGAAFFNVFGFLAGGPDDTSDFLDVICGMVVVIVFLNVVIAIVSNAW